MKSNSKSINVMSLIALLGGVLAIVGFFLTVVTIDIDLILGTATTELNGSGVMDFNIQGHKADLSAMVYMPVVALVFGILTVLVSLLPLLTNKISGKNVAILQGLFGIITLVCGIVFMVSGCSAGMFAGDWNTAIQSAVDNGIVTFSAGPGTYLAIAGGAVSLVGGVLGLKGSR